MKYIKPKAEKIRYPASKLNEFVSQEKYISHEFNKSYFDEFGVFVVKDFFSKEKIKRYSCLYDELISGKIIKKDDYHRTQVRVDDVAEFKELAFTDDLKNLGLSIFSSGVALDFYRIVKKDATNPNPVFLHQDSCYSIGHFDAVSIFVALTKCNAANGGLYLFPGSKNFSHLGDAGTIEDSIVGDD